MCPPTCACCCLHVGIDHLTWLFVLFGAAALSFIFFGDNSLWHVHAYFWRHVNPLPSFPPTSSCSLSDLAYHSLTVVVCNEGLVRALSLTDCLWEGASGVYQERVEMGGWVDKRQNTSWPLLKTLAGTVGIFLCVCVHECVSVTCCYLWARWLCLLCWCIHFGVKA